jgi:hypothetical protein
MIRRHSILILLLVAAGCGYSWGSRLSVSELSVSVFDNLTERRDHEFELARQVVQEVRQAGVKVKPTASMRLEGEIMKITLPALAESSADAVLVGSFSMKIRYRLVDRSGKVLWEKTDSGSATFDTLRGKPVSAARREVFRRLGEGIVSKLEGGW